MPQPFDRDPHQGGPLSLLEQLYWETAAWGYGLVVWPLGGAVPRCLSLTQGALQGSERVLEVAAGTGIFTRALASRAREVVATDYAASMVQQLKATAKRERWSNVTCQQANLYELPFEPGTFDVVMAANVLHLVPDLAGALRHLYRMLIPGGLLLAPTFCHGENLTAQNLSMLLGLTGLPIRRRFSGRSLCASLEGAGLRIHTRETVAGLIPICFVAARFPHPEAERFAQAEVTR